LLLAIDKIRTDGGTQMRERIYDETVDDYAADLAAGATLPPPVIFDDGADFWPADGFHRIAAHRRNGRSKIKCEVRPGGRRDAMLYAVGANVAHGRRCTNADKHKAVQTLLADEEWSALSNHKIARLCAVTHPLVGRLRKAANGNDYQLAPAAPSSGLAAPIKWHGGKQPLASRIVAMMPAHTTYVEPYAGGLAVLLAKLPDGVCEIVNDLDGNLTNFWTALREPALFKRLLRLAQATPFSEPAWRECGGQLADPDPARRAWAFLVYCRQSMGARMKDFAELSVTRTRRGMCEQSAAWLSAVDGLADVHARLKRVAILNRDALAVIEKYDSPDTLFYLDPPYLPEARATPDVYAHEMTFEEHKRLLELLASCRGKVILSGYASELYERQLRTWQRIDIERANSAAGGDVKRRMIERLWLNFTPAPAPTPTPAIASGREAAA
jgi:DNA adenine methylase